MDNVILKRSIMSCSFEVFTGAGGSGRAKALDGVAAGKDEVALLLFTGKGAPPVSAEVF